jgi:hypothetical protein
MKTFFTLALASMAFMANAQSSNPEFRFKTALSFNPTVLLATDYTVMLGAEHRLPHYLALVLDAGYIFGSYYFNDNVQKGVRGFAVRPGLKLYNRSEKGFFQFQVAYKQVDYTLEDWLGKGCVNKTPAYEKLQEFTYRKKALSFNVLAGELFRISDAVFVELYGGAGVKFKFQRPTEEATCYRDNETGFGFNTFEEKYITANVPLGVKLLVAIK